MGGAPFGFWGLPRALYEKHGIRGVINLCDEYPGPTRHYQSLGMVELRLPTVDHFEPSVQSLQSAVSFIQDYAHRGERVYVHCRAGHGRSAAVVMAWTMATTMAAATTTKDASTTCSTSDVDFMKRINQQLCQKRNVRKTLWKQPNLRQFHQLLLEQMRDDASDNVAVADETQQELLEQQRDDTVASVAESTTTIQQQDDKYY
ncbi:Protein-tyrosine phosphatase [Fragilaria crotonensis]|nr:Protein-tyrosine phosphatase [Fragilaria crotonensis]